MTLIYERIFKLLDRLTGDIVAFAESELVKGYLKLEVNGFMPLVVENITVDRRYPEISLTHYWELNGDLMKDPEITVRVHPVSKLAEALTFEQSDFGLFQRVYPEPGKVDLQAKKDLNNFLLFWLRNMIKQGFFDKRAEIVDRKK